MTEHRICRLPAVAICLGGLLFVATPRCQAINFETGIMELSACVGYSGTWKFYIDPVQVLEFQLSVEFDSQRAQLMSITFLNGYKQEGALFFDPANENVLHNIHGVNFDPPPVEVDVVKLEFFDLMPNLDPTTALFRVFADEGQIDFVTIVDPPSDPITLLHDQIIGAETFARIIPPDTAGTVEIISELLIDSPPGILAVMGDVEITPCGEVNVTPGYAQASATIETILAVTYPGVRTGVFINEGLHLRDGLFVDTIYYNPNDITVDILQAAPGDLNGDRMVDATDIQLILAANSFNNGGGFDWTQGDNNGDGLINAVDIQNILAANLFGAGAYVALPGSAAAVPEPSSITLVACGLVVLLCRRWRRRQR